MRLGASPGRLDGVDAARGVALLGMMAVHVMPAVGRDGAATTTYLVASGRAAALFAVLAGVGLALASGGRTPQRGTVLHASRAGVVVRALVLGAVGLTLGYVDTPAAIILAYYALLFAGAAFFLGLTGRTLAVLAGAWMLLAPVVSHLVRGALHGPVRANPTFDSLADPELVSTLTLTGYYPVFVWLGYLLAGMAVGRLALSTTRVAAGLAVGGAGLGLVAKGLSTVTLVNLDGLDVLRRTVPDGSPIGYLGLDASLDTSFYGTTPTTSWWWLSVSAPHSGTPLDMLHTTGVALAVLGVALLVVRVARLPLLPLVAAGGMTLTLYSAHVVVLGLGWGPAQPAPLLVTHVLVALTLATLWRSLVGKGPAERLTSAADRRTRRLVTSRQRRSHQKSITLT